jgi:hypothetical protein
MWVFMPAQVQTWMPTILALFGSLLVVVFSAWLNTKALSSQIDGVDKKLTAQIDGIDKKLTAQIDGIDKKLTAQIEALRAETLHGFAELRLEFQIRS